jgi:IclR family acetate operon transcriptional repressor
MSRSGTTTSGDDDRDTVQSVGRALTILQLIAQQGEATCSELGRALSVNRSTAFRILATLEARGMVVQDGARGSYRIGEGVIALAAGASRHQLPLTAVARPACEELAAETAETVNIAIFDGDAVISVDQVLGSATVRSVNWIGQRTPAHATSAGKVFLAYLPELHRRRLLSAGLQRYTSYTITDPVVLGEELASVRRSGYSTTHEEHEYGLAAVAAPIFDSAGTVAAAVTVSGPASRFDAARTPQLADAVVRVARGVSKRLGWATTTVGRAERAEPVPGADRVG